MSTWNNLPGFTNSAWNSGNVRLLVTAENYLVVVGLYHLEVNYKRSFVDPKHMCEHLEDSWFGEMAQRDTWQ